MAKAESKGVNYGIKLRCYPTEEQVEYFNGLMDDATKFWNILVYEQCRPFWKRNFELRQMYKEEWVPLNDKLEVYYTELGKTLKDITKLIKKHKEKYFKRAERKWNKENPMFWVFWWNFSTVYKDWGFKCAKKDWVAIKEYAKMNYPVEYEKWVSAPRNKMTMAISGDSYYQYGTTRSYNGNDPIKLPSAIALGVVKSLHETWSKVKMAPERFNEKTKTLLPDFINAKGFPKTKKDKRGKREGLTSLRYDSGNAKAITAQLPDTEGECEIKLPSLKGSLKVNFHRIDIDLAKVCYFGITKEGEEWYFSLNVNSDKQIKQTKNKDLKVGIDMGCKTLITATDENGNTTTLERVEKVAQRLDRLDLKLRSANKHVSKIANACGDVKNNPSNNYIRAKQAKGRIQNKINRIHKNLRHHVTNVLTKKYGYIIIEDLKVAEMSKHDGSRKKMLNRNILSQGWGEIKLMLSYKSKQRGCNLIKVDPRYTSQACSKCGHTESNNRKTQADFHCLKCGMEMNADVNASINILNLGLVEINNLNIDKVI